MTMPIKFLTTMALVLALITSDSALAKPDIVMSERNTQIIVRVFQQ